MSSEEVLLIVKHVKVKKSEGRLYLMGSRMAWMQASSDTFAISHYYADIRVQKISPDTKDKVQLQVQMHDGSAMTFQFSNPAGRTAQQQDREGVKELLQQLLPKFRKKVDSELEEKNRMLKEDPELFQLYKDLVVSGIISTDEFWSNRKNNKLNKVKSAKQEIGVSGAFLSDIKHTDGCNGLKFNLTADTIEAIFRTYPAVKRTHAENVPHKLTETEFWTRFFQSHYFHRDRINLGGNKEIFAACAKHDEQVMQEEKEKKKNYPLVDLSTMSDGIVGEGYGVERELDKSALPAAAAANASMIRRFNHHSTMVLKAAEKHTAATQNETQLNGTIPPSVAAASTSKPPHPSNVSNGHSAQDPGEPPPKRAKLKEKIQYEDLAGEEDTTSTGGPALRLTKMDRYLHGPTPVSAMQYKTSDDVLRAHQRVMHDMLAWKPDLSQVLSNNVAVAVLGELSPGGALMQGFSQQQLHQLVPQDVQKELKNLYNALCELLRHFWSCFPANTPFLEDKVVKMRANLEKFQFSKINPMKQQLQSTHDSLNLCGHMEEMLAAAFNKFNAWQTKRMSRR